MKRTHKRILGFLGLALVAGTTVFAASLPGPEASATTSVTDTITVRVVGSSPDINVSSPTSGAEVVRPDQNIKLTYENVETVTVELEYTDVDGVTHAYPIGEIDADYQADGKEYPLDLSGADYGYGEYVLRVTGTGYGGVTDEDAIAFAYYPVVAEVHENTETGMTVVDLDYLPTSEGGDVAEVEINIYDENGELVKELSPIKVEPGAKSVELPIEKFKPGTYRVEVVAKDASGKELYKPYGAGTFKYDPTKVPDTGSFFSNLNISRADYLITGLIAFFAFGLFGICFILKKQKKSSRRR